MFTGRIVDGFLIQDIIGEGAFSEVYCGTHELTGCRAAIKVIDLKKMTPHEKEGFYAEISALISAGHHPYVANLFHYSLSDDHLFLFMEYVSGGSIIAKMHKIGNFAEQQARKHFLEILSALAFLHSSLSVFHRDIKLNNILLSYDGRAQLIDFGLCVPNEPHTDYAGTPGYSAPEVIAEKQYDSASDLFSLGVCLYTMVTGQAPFESHRDYDRFIQEIENLPYPDSLSPAIVKLLKGLLEPNPSKRWSYSQILNSEWIQESGFSNFQFSYPLNRIPLKLPSDIPFEDALKSLRFLPTLNPDAKTLEDVEKLGFDRNSIIEKLKTGTASPEATTFFIQLHLNQVNKVVPLIERACSHEAERFLNRLNHL